MRCISPFANYSICAIEGQEKMVMDARGVGQSIQLQKPVICDFDKSGLLDNEIEVALENFTFSGLPEGVNPLTRISVFDTEAYAERFPANERDELVLQLDERLRELQERHPSEFIIVEPAPKRKPWPKYDDLTVEEVLALQEQTETDPELIRLYELENQNREEIVRAMLKLEGDPEALSDEEETIVNA